MACRLRCPDCRGTFPWVAGESIPNFCPLCAAKVGGQDRADDDVVMPFLRKAATSATDKVYRDMERGSEVRAQVAADAIGVPISEMSGMKITDMNDHQRAGDIAAKEDTAAMERLQAATPAPIGFQSNGAEYAAGTASGAVSINGQMLTGIEPRAGARAAQKLQRIMGRG